MLVVADGGRQRPRFLRVVLHRLLLGQDEREFRVKLEAIGHVRHKNLVHILGCYVEGTQRMLVYEYVNNGNLVSWLHG
ncbi:hypothetical protein GUJ93_ZPchr0011g28331 [Zizania palustris]|uniref:Serine-threonine/tyrosine-protein kinase catalytic domain-containing protein n=1 Tax=Zizania palustris TaxID=103762 RepID=A0A8J5WGD7_ZIZPA|nr:hypothetical protein GUJ93_ZPchr0011g28331 [Zizania palustris]KAG8091087.1 hypothetical protein GUJ93_ZPchr0011g28331 [Zizania palustris]KAG8091088.1 hypothetical protein GUJ93_ZPchr0011g28331 [Zizania palustris]